MGMTPNRIDEIRARAAAATPGPWECWYVAPRPFCQVRANDWAVAGQVETLGDGAFIAHARTDVDDLLGALAAAQAELAARDRRIKRALQAISEALEQGHDELGRWESIKEAEHHLKASLAFASDAGDPA